MPRYEFRQGTSSKFWEVTVAGATLTTSYGRIGAKPQATSKDLGSPEAAAREAEKQAAAKVKKGYVLVEPGAGGGAPGAAPEGLVGLEKENVDTNEHAERFVFRRVVPFDPEGGLEEAAKGVAYWIGLTYDDDSERMGELVEAILQDPRADRLQALVIGPWGSEMLDSGADEVIRQLVAGIARLPELRAIYLGDATQEESELSWISMDDFAPLLRFPKLEHLRVRLGSGTVGELSSETLRSLCLQSGGLPGEIVEAVGRAHLPALEHLELWLGTEDYGGIATPDALAPLLSGKLFPNLRYLGLRNAQIADAVAAAVASSPLLERLEVLDLSLGALGDAGAEALLAAPATAKLRRLDLHHNYMTPPVAQRVRGLGIDVDVRALLADEDGEEGERYISISE